MPTTKQLRRLSRKLRPINKRFTNINDGGCGVFAYFLAKELKRRNIDATIAVDTASKGFARAWNSKQYTNDFGTIRGALWSHVLVVVKNNHGNKILIDSNNIYSEPLDDELAYTDVSILQQMIKDVPHWNDDFPRRQMLGMARFIKQTVKKFYDQRTRRAL